MAASEPRPGQGRPALVQQASGAGAAVPAVAEATPASCHLRFEWSRKSRKKQGGSLPKSVLADLLRPFGVVEDVFMASNGCRAWASLSTSEEAAAALVALHGRTFGEVVSPPELCPKPFKFRRMFVFFTEESVHAAQLCRTVVPDSTIVTSAPPVPGASVVLELLSEDEEAELLAFFDSQPWSSEIKRRTQHYGYAFKYGSRGVDPSAPIRGIPDGLCADLLERLRQRGTITTIPDQMTVQEYTPGAGISPHVDTHSAFGDELLSISLGSLTVMRMRGPGQGGGTVALSAAPAGTSAAAGTSEAAGTSAARTVDIALPRRSAFVMAGEARYAWTHAIPERTVDRVGAQGVLQPRGRRVSMTFRTVRVPAVCRCPYRNQCDTQCPEKQRSNTTPPSNEERDPTIEPQECAKMGAAGASARGARAGGASGDAVASAGGAGVPALEREHVHGVYDAIGRHFGETRSNRVRRRVDQFLAALPIGSVAVDLGCGHGQYVCGGGSIPQKPPPPPATAVSVKRPRVERDDAAEPNVQGGELGDAERGDAERGDAAPQLLLPNKSESKLGLGGDAGPTKLKPVSDGQRTEALWAGPKERGARVPEGGAPQRPVSSRGVIGPLYRLGLDRCWSMVEQCAERAGQVLQADVLALPFRDGSVDAAISVAVLHHLCTPARRQAAVAEMARILRPGGRLIIYAWAQEQRPNQEEGKGKARQFEASDVLVPWHLPSRYRGHTPRGAASAHDSLRDTDVYQRYCHVFKNGELQRLVDGVNASATAGATGGPDHDSPDHGRPDQGSRPQQSGGEGQGKKGSLPPLLTLVDSFYDQGNWCVLAQKHASEHAGNGVPAGT